MLLGLRGMRGLRGMAVAAAAVVVVIVGVFETCVELSSSLPSSRSKNEKTVE